MTDRDTDPTAGGTDRGAPPNRSITRSEERPVVGVEHVETSGTPTRHAARTGTS